MGGSIFFVRENIMNGYP